MATSFFVYKFIRQPTVCGIISYTYRVHIEFLMNCIGLLVYGCHDFMHLFLLNAMFFKISFVFD